MMPVTKTRIGDDAVPARNATTKAKITGLKPMSGCTVYFTPNQKAATPHRTVPMAKHDQVDLVRGRCR